MKVLIRLHECIRWSQLSEPTYGPGPLHVLPGYVSVETLCSFSKTNLQSFVEVIRFLTVLYSSVEQLEQEFYKLYNISLTLKALSKFVADKILKLILFFKENKATFHVNCMLYNKTNISKCPLLRLW